MNQEQQNKALRLYKSISENAIEAYLLYYKQKINYKKIEKFITFFINDIKREIEKRNENER